MQHGDQLNAVADFAILALVIAFLELKIATVASSILLENSELAQKPLWVILTSIKESEGADPRPLVDLVARRLAPFFSQQQTAGIAISL